MSVVYEVVFSVEEDFYVTGVWLDYKSALENAQNPDWRLLDGIEIPENVFLEISIKERHIGWSGDGRMVWHSLWERTRSEEEGGAEEWQIAGSYRRFYPPIVEVEDE